MGKNNITAVEWLTERLTLSLGDEIKDIKGFFVIAKEMEKEQIIKAIEDWYSTDIESAEQYYKETYGKE